MNINEPAAENRWAELRSGDFLYNAMNLIQDTSGLTPILTIEHERSAHYGVYRVTTRAGYEWIARIGVAGETSVQNDWYLGTASATPTGQKRELEIAQGLHEAGASVSVPAFCSELNGWEVMWMKRLPGTNQGITAEQWAAALHSLRAYKPQERLPVFTNRVKSLNRLRGIPESQAALLGREYDEGLRRLFDVASSWSVVHGDAHSGNALLHEGKVTLFDFDTACWAPSIWDWTHLLNRAGQGEDNGYTAAELASLSGFGSIELDAALALRRTASRIAMVAREQGAFLAA